MDSSRKRTLGILISAMLGLAACGTRLYFEYRKPPSVVYRTSDEEIAEGSVTQTQSSEYIESDEPAQNQSDLSGRTISSSIDSLPDTIPVYLCGSINKPGVYFINRGSFLFEVIELAGGLNKEAAEEHINLVMTLDEPISVYIPSASELINAEPRTPEQNITGLIRKGPDEYVWGANEISEDNTGKKANVETKININTADEQELTRLAGVGEVTAAAIIRFRSENGLFVKIEDIMKVPGIKQGRFDAFKAMIEV